MTDQRNEIFLNPGTTAGTVTLKCTYFNTLLKCGGIATRKINISQTVAIAGPDTACLTEAASYTSSSGTIPTWSYRLLPNGVPTGTFEGETYELVFPSAGQYEILLTTTNSCGNTSKLVTVVGVPILQANQLVGSTTICQGTPSTFSINNTVPNTIIGWQVTNGTITGSNYGSSITANFNNANPAVYNLTVWRESTLPPFCKSASTTIPLLQTIINTTISGPIAPCGSTTATYTNPTTTADNLEWLVVPPSAGNIVGVNNTNTVQVLWNEAIAGQTPSLRLKISKCNRTVVAVLPVIISNPQLVLSTPLLTFCGGIAQPFTVTAVTPLTAGTVTWNFGDGITETTSNNVFTTSHVFNNAATSNASYTVTATIAYPNGCNVTIIKTIMVTVKPSPIAKITPAVDKCSTDFNLILPADRVLVLDIQNSNGVTIKWFKDNAVIAGATTTSYTVSSFGTYYATVNNSVCSKTTNAVKFFSCSTPIGPCTITPTPNIVINGITSTCGAMSATASYAGTAISKKWINLATNTVLSTTNVMNNWVTEPGSYLYAFEAAFTNTTGQPCTLNKLTTIIVPYIVDLKTDVTCPSTTAGQYNVTLFDFSKIYAVTPITAWQFYVNNVLKAKNTTLGDLDTNRHITLAPGTYTLKLIVGAAGQASCTKTITLVLPAFPTAVIATGGGTTCPENGMPFTTATQPGCSYEWTIKQNGSPYATNLQQNPTFTFTSSTTLPTLYSVSLKVTNSIGCSANSIATQVRVPAVNLAGSLPLSMGKCQGESASIGFINSGGPIASYQWMNNNVPVLAPAGITNPLVTTTQGAYWVKIGNTAGCKVPIINPKCTVTFAAQNVAIAGSNTCCLTNTVRLTAAIAGGSIAGESNALYEWRRNDVNYVIATTPILEDIPSAVGNYTYTLTLLTPSGSGAYCTSTATQTVAVVLAPTITSLYYDTVTCNPYSFRLHATANMPGTFNWSNGQTGADLTTSFGGAYKVLFTSASGCTTTAQLQTPRSPESYLWEFPSGCFTFCSKIDYSRKFLGPALAKFSSGWVWNALATAPALAPTISGLDAMTPYNINFEGGSYKYDMILYASPQCSYKSKPAYIQNIGCSTSCNLHTFTQSTTNPLKVVPSATNPYLYYQLKFNFLPNEKVIRLININNDGVFVPSTINVPAGGLTNFIIKFIPNTLPYTGPIQIGLTALERGVYCESFQDIILSNGPSARVKVGLLAGFTLDLVPNPAKSYVSISYTFIEKDAAKTITIYDLTGRMLKQKVIGSLKDVWEVPTDDLAAGQYMVVMKEDGTVVMQKNLLKTD